MPKVTLTFNEAQAARVEPALRDLLPWTGTKAVDGEEVPTADSRTAAALVQQFAKLYLGQIVRRYEEEIARAAIGKF